MINTIFNTSNPYIDDIDVKVYVIYHKPYFKIDSDVLVPISPTKQFDLDMISADTLDNIAYDNKRLSEYSTFYWVWKNDLTSKYVGFFHYRRYLCFEEQVNVPLSVFNPAMSSIYKFKWDKATLLKLINKYDLIIPIPRYFDTNIYEQYLYWHGDYVIKIALDFIKEKYPSIYPFAISALNKNYGYYRNMFICKREIFNGYISFCMDIFDDINKKVSKYNYDREMGYLGERLFSVYVEYLRCSTKYKIGEVPELFIPNPDGSNVSETVAL